MRLIYNANDFQQWNDATTQPKKISSFSYENVDLNLKIPFCEPVYEFMLGRRNITDVNHIKTLVNPT